MPHTITIPDSEVLETLISEVREASFGEMDQGDLRTALRKALKEKRKAETGEKYAYCYINEVFQTFIVCGEEEDSETYEMRYYKRPYTVSGAAVTVGDRQMEVELAWVPALVQAMEAALKPEQREEVQQAREAEEVLNAVRRGEPTQEALDCAARTERATETVDSFREASFVEGKIEGIVPIRPGISKNNRRYSEAVLQRDVKVFEGLPVFYDHQDPNEPKPLKNVLGVLENARWDADARVPRADLRYPKSAEAAISDIRDKHSMFGPDKVGFSIDMELKSKLTQVAGKVVQNVEALMGGWDASCDVVWNPAAGGGFDRALEAQLQELTMPEITLAQLRESHPELVAEIENGVRESVKVEEKAEKAVETKTEEKPAEKATETVSASDIAKMVREATAQASRQAKFEARVEGSKLPKKVQEAMLREAEAAEWEQAKLDGIYEDWANQFAATSGGVRVAIPGGGGLKVTESVEKRYARLMGAAEGARFGVKVGDEMVKPFSSLSQAIVAFHPEYRDMLIDNPGRFARECFQFLHWGGGDVSEALESKSRESIISTTFSNAWADVMQKMLLKSVADPELSIWRRLVSDIVPFKDLTNSKKLVRVGDYPDLATVAEGAPYQPITDPDEEKVEFGIDKYGNTADYTWESALADDLNVLAQIPRKLGLAWAWTLYRLIFSLFTANSGDGATCDYDSTSLYHANHANNTDSAFSVANLVTAEGLMRNQTDISQSNPKMYRARFLLYASATALRQSIWEALRSEYKITASAAEINLPNYVREFFGLEPVEVYYPDNSTTRCELVGNPDYAGTIAVGFLNGSEMPEIFVQDMERVGSVFNADKITYKIRATAGCEIVDHRSFSRIDK